MGKAPSHKHERVSVPKWAKEQDQFRKEKKYPNCAGTFPECPTEIDINKEPIDECKKCPMYKGI